MGGFTDTVRSDLLAERRGEHLILLLDRADLQQWIDSPRETWLKARIERAVVEG